MFVWGNKSLKVRETLHPDLIVLFDEVLKSIDCVLIEGFRNKEDQEKAFNSGASKKHFPDGNHNKMPSLAVDVAPYPINWHDTQRFCHLAGFVLATAKQLLDAGKISHRVRWGGDWDMKNDRNPKGSLDDLPHFELIGDN